MSISTSAAVFTRFFHLFRLHIQQSVGLLRRQRSAAELRGKLIASDVFRLDVSDLLPGQIRRQSLVPEEFLEPPRAPRGIKLLLAIQYDFLIARNVERLRQRAAAGIVRAPAPRGDARKPVHPDREKCLRPDPIRFNDSFPLIRQSVERDQIVAAVCRDQIAAEEDAVIVRHLGGDNTDPRQIVPQNAYRQRCGKGRSEHFMNPLIGKIRPDGSLPFIVAGNVAVDLAAHGDQPCRKVSAGGDAISRRLQILLGKSADLFVRQLPPGELFRTLVQNLVRTAAFRQRHTRRKSFRRYGGFPRSGCCCRVFLRFLRGRLCRRRRSAGFAGIVRRRRFAAAGQQQAQGA